MKQGIVTIDRALQKVKVGVAGLLSVEGLWRGHRPWLAGAGSPCNTACSSAARSPAPSPRS
jgi:hypothetical protein